MSTTARQITDLEEELAEYQDEYKKIKRFRALSMILPSVSILLILAATLIPAWNSTPFLIASFMIYWVISTIVSIGFLTYIYEDKKIVVKSYFRDYPKKDSRIRAYPILIKSTKKKLNEALDSYTPWEGMTK